MTGSSTQKKQTARDEPAKADRIAKVMARAGLCSRREAERWIADGRVAVNGTVLTTPAMTVTAKDKVTVDGKPLPTRDRTRLWLYNKPRGLVTTNADPQGRPTLFSALPADLPRTISVGRLDINTEGLLLLTNDGGLARILELPSTGWLRRYRVRAHGRVDPQSLEGLSEGVTIDGMIYGAIEAAIDREQGANLWLTIGLREGKNREVRRVLEHLGLTVNRLIRVSYGPFQLGDLAPGEIREIRGRVLRDQLGETLITKAGLDFSARDKTARSAQTRKPPKKDPRPGAGKGGRSGRKKRQGARKGADNAPEMRGSAPGKRAKVAGKSAGKRKPNAKNHAHRRRPV